MVGATLSAHRISNDIGNATMVRSQNLREQAAKFREYARTDSSGVLRPRLLELATQCEDLAASIEAADKRQKKDGAAGGE